MPIKHMDLCDPRTYLDREYVSALGGISSQGYWAKLCEKLVDFANPSRNDVVADLGCGYGFLTQFLIDRVAPIIYAVDPSPAMLRNFPEKFTMRVKVFQGDIDTLIWEAQPRPNMIISSGVFVVLENPIEVLKKIYSYLPEEGTYTFGVENWENANVGGMPLDDYVAKMGELEQKIGLNIINGFYSFANKAYSPKDVIDIVTKSGGKVLDWNENEMSHPARFNHQYELEKAQDKFDSFRKYGFSYRPSPELVLQLEALEEMKAMTEGKTLVAGTQYHFKTTRA